MRLEDIKKEYNNDSMDPSEPDLGGESLRIPNLHSKYLDILMNEKDHLQELESELDVLLLDKWEYYTGKMSQADLKARGWAPFQLKVLKGDLDKYINADADLIERKAKVDAQRRKVEYVDRVLKEIMARNWIIKNAINWRMFMAGAT